MPNQSYSNHIKWYAPHHFVFYPLLTILFAFSIYHSLTAPEKAIWIFISIIFMILIWLAFMLRQHYALILQNRIIKLELKYRYFTLTGKRLEDLNYNFRDSQTFALRFASDTELEALVEKTVSKRLSSNSIKKYIKNWKGDYDRV